MSDTVKNQSTRYLTGIKPTGMPHLGNYYGAIKPAINFSNQHDGEFFYFIADYHSLTSIRDPKEHQQYLYEVAATWLACGLDTSKVIFYKQSDVPEIFELNWILACHTPKGDLNRAHAYKAIVQDNREQGQDDDYSVNTGLYTYPVLMAADILMFDTHVVPVGKDQIQHVEMARSMGSRMNQIYRKELFHLPQELLQEQGAYIPGLDGRKMSKSYGNTIGLFLAEKKLQKMINKIVTDSTAPDEPKDPNDSFLFDLYSIAADPNEVQTMRRLYKEGIGWGEVKAKLFTAINSELTPLRGEYMRLMDNPREIDDLLAQGAVKARGYAQKKLAFLKKSLLGG